MKDDAAESRITSFVSDVRRTVERRGMDLSRTLALVSGGPDSVAMLRSLIELGSEVSVLHLDHGLRGRESTEDADFVASLCAGLDVPCEVVRLNLTDGGNVQERARHERYRIARKMVHRTHCTSIATGHNAGDVAETVLINLSRGAGLRGLSGISPVSDGVVRPLIERSRDEILAYLDALGQPYRTDETNLTGKYTRNRMRLEVMPLLEEMYPGVRKNLSRTATLVSCDLEILESLASEAVEERSGEVAVVPAKLPHPGLLPHALRVAYSRLEPESHPLEYGRIEDISRLLGEGVGTKTLQVSGGVTVAVRNGEEIAFYRDSVISTDGFISLSMGESGFGEWRIHVSEVNRLDREDAARPEVAHLDADKGPYFVRRVREGDTIRPLGLGGTKKVFRAMMDRKIPSDLRSEIPVVTDEADAVAWVFLGETDERYVVGEETRKVLRVEVERA